MRRELDQELDPDIERVAAAGSCARCGRALGLASAEVNGLWYGNSGCASGGACPLEEHPPAVAEAALFSRPRRFFRRRRPKELLTHDFRTTAGRPRA
jgi:hypothetical protein